MSEHVAVEKLNGEATAVHYIRLPDFTESGHYRAVRAFEGFENAMHRWFTRHMYVDPKDSSKGFYIGREVPGQYFYIAWADDFEITKKHSHGFYEALPTMRWDSIYDFLNRVQYDRKRRKLTSWDSLKGNK